MKLTYKLRERMQHSRPSRRIKEIVKEIAASIVVSLDMLLIRLTEPP